ncbi:MAG: Crp/Fnr family transcriptional regulator [Rhodospirillales bacterium]|nr:Crp/Fnr family transcriptional regulator [Acetobacter sp.]
MPERLIAKLSRFAPFTSEQRHALRSLVRKPRQVAPRMDIQREGEMHRGMHLLLDGFAMRYKELPGGSRQVVALMVPGDVCGAGATLLHRADHSVATLTSSTVTTLEPDALMATFEAHPIINRAFSWSSLVDEATLREWLLNLGRRLADKRIAHLFCEMLVRLQNVGCAAEDSLQFPLTQSDLADITGLSVVHVNRTLNALRADGLISRSGRVLMIPDVPKLKAFCGFDGNYLHLEGQHEIPGHPHAV